MEGGRTCESIIYIQCIYELFWSTTFRYRYAFYKKKGNKQMTYSVFFPSRELLKALNHSISLLSILYTHQVLGKPINILEGFKWY